jgi:hypothetical protein
MFDRLRKAAALLALGLAVSLVSAAERDEAWLRQRVKRVKDRDTSAWRKVPWAPSLLEARRVAAKERRPVFLFTLDGNMDTGRC